MDLGGTFALVALVAAVGAAVFATLRTEAAGHPQLLPLALLGAALGGFAGSEWFGTLSDWGPTYDGLNALPAFIGAAVVGAMAGLSGVAPAQELHP